MKQRPDLSYITRLSGIRDKNQFNSIVRELNERQLIVYDSSIDYIPELVCIAEMFYDSMVGTPAEESIPFKVVEKVLNDIAGIPAQKLNDCDKDEKSLM